jgi:RNA polymerase sigma factor (sigma-70 family)
MRLSRADLTSASGSSSVTAAVRLPVATAPQRPNGRGVDPSKPEAADGAADFESVRSRLFGIAYQMLGRAADAEDVVQDVWVRWQGADRKQVRDPVAFLVTVTTRAALNAATSARARREITVGGGLPERSVASLDPALGAERTEALELAVQLLVERLSPVERAVYVLREAFDYPFLNIAETLDISEANARQLARRARKHVAGTRRNEIDPAERDGLLDAFLDAARVGAMARLVGLLSDAVVRSGTCARIGTRAPVMAAE